MSLPPASIDRTNQDPAGTSPPGGALPASLTPLIGRAEELDRMSRVLRERAARLLVLTGPGGVGKTRLALAVAENVQDQYRDGVLLINLSPVNAAEGVLAAIASVLGVREANVDQLYAAVREALHDREMLLVLDNFEQVVQAAPILTELLTASHALTMLVTSRSVLGVYGEFVFPVPPMPVPHLSTTSIEEIGGFDAVQLFVNRVRALRPDFRLTAQNAQAVATICNRLDGLPLAIELAAARTSLFTVSTLAQRLDLRLPVLEGGPHNVPGRLRTMRNAITWSYELLSPREQAVFRRLAVFNGSWNLDAAEAVALPEGGDEVELIETVGSLVDKSLIQRVEPGEQDRAFQLLQTLRDFAMEALELAGELAQTQERHACYILGLAKRAQPHLTGRAQVSWLNRLEMLYGDIQVTFERLMESNLPEHALQLATSIWRFGYTRGHILETQSWLERALAEATDRTSLRAKALNGAGVLSNMAGDFERTRAYHEEALDIAREMNDTRTMATALSGLGELATINHDEEAAERYYEEVERIYTELHDDRGIAVAQTNLGNLYWMLGRVDEALKLNEAARRLYESAGDQRGVAWSVTNVGRLAAERKEFGRAITNLSEAMELYGVLGDRSGIAETLESFALVATGASDLARAATLLSAAAELRKQIGHPVPQHDRASYTRLLSHIERELGADFDAFQQAGARMRLDDVIAMTLTIRATDAVTHTPKLGGGQASRQVIEQRGITERELEVLQRLGAGESDKQIAEHLFISVRTVQSHVQNLLNKFGATSRSAAVARAFRDGILT